MAEMKKFDICLNISGIVSYVIEAKTLDEAEKIARRTAYESDWNQMSCPEVEVLDYEEVHCPS